MDGIHEPGVAPLVWWAAVGDGWADREHLMSESERRHITALRRTAARDAQACSYVMRREVVGHVMGVDAANVEFGRSCGQCGSTVHGAPVVHGLQGTRLASMSISHSEAAVGIALSDVQVGLDIELVREEAELADVRPFVEHRDDSVTSELHRWTGKEAALKSLGVGLAVPMTEVRLRGSCWNLPWARGSSVATASSWPAPDALASYVQHRGRAARDAQLGNAVVAWTTLLMIAALIESYLTGPTAALLSRG